MRGWLRESCKREVGKDSMIECSPGDTPKLVPTRTLRVPIYCAGQVRGRLIIVCGAPGLRPDGEKKNSTQCARPCEGN